jgi:membrane protease subunit HflC
MGKVSDFIKMNYRSIATAVAALTFYSSVYTIDQTEQAVITRLGKPKGVILNPISTEDKERIEGLKAFFGKEGLWTKQGPGLYFKLPFIESVNRFDRRLQRWDGFPEQVPTKDKKYIWEDTTARWEIEDPYTFFLKIKTEELGHARLDDIVDSNTRNSLTARDILNIVRSSDRKMTILERDLAQEGGYGGVKEGRSAIMREISEKCAADCKPFGIRIVENGVLLKGLMYVDEVKKSLTDRMISERERIAQKFESEGKSEYDNLMGRKAKEVNETLSKATKQAKEIEGAAEAKATDIYAKMYNKNPELYRFLKSLETYEQSLSTNTTLVIGTDNPLLKYFKGAECVKSVK